MFFFCRHCLESIIALEWYFESHFLSLLRSLSLSFSLSLCFSLPGHYLSIFSFVINSNMRILLAVLSFWMFQWVRERHTEGQRDKESERERERDRERNKEREDERPLWLHYCCSAEACAPPALSGCSHRAAIFRHTPLTIAAKAWTQCWRARNIGC